MLSAAKQLKSKPYGLSRDHSYICRVQYTILGSGADQNKGDQAMKRALLAGLAGLMLMLTACTVGPKPTQVSMNDILTAVAATIAARKTAAG